MPEDHLVRQIGAVLDLSWVHAELAPYYSPLEAAQGDRQEGSSEALEKALTFVPKRLIS